jgi:hypothetical protein
MLVLKDTIAKKLKGFKYCGIVFIAIHCINLRFNVQHIPEPLSSFSAGGEGRENGVTGYKEDEV